MKTKYLYVSTLYEKVESDCLDFPFYVASSPLVGYLLNNGRIFLDVISGEKFLNIDETNSCNLDYGFDNPVLLKDLEKNKLFSPVAKYFQNAQDYIYYYIGDERIGSTKRDFMNNFSVNINFIDTNSMNEYMENLISGRLSPSEYSKLVNNNRIDSNKTNTKLNEEKKMSMIPFKEALRKINSMVISQEEAVKRILISIYKTKIFDNNIKSNILIYGPSGCGKTEIVRSIDKVLDIPVLIEDMTKYTDRGYVGSSVDDILIHLYNNANGDLERAENSILYLDEIDKKASNGDEKDFNKADVLSGLLKIIEGGIFQIEIGGNYVNFDTSKLIVIAGGAFSKLYNQTKSKINKIGFIREENDVEKIEENTDVKTLENYGMLIEFLGRFKCVIRMNTLSLDDFIKILKISELSPIKKYIDLFKGIGIELQISEDIYERIARIAYNYGTGARAINVVVEEIFDDIFYNIIDDIDSIENIFIDQRILDSCDNLVLKRKRVSDGFSAD